MVLSSPAYTIGTGKRSNDIKTGVYYVPGSGAYNPVKNQRINPPSWKIGSASRNPKLIENFPGPGAYENNETKLTKTHFPKYKFGIKTSLGSSRGLTPGPGAYDPRGLGKTFPEFSFASKGYNHDLYNNPGPGSYEVLKPNNILTRPSSKIGSSQREGLYKTNGTPGPGAYDHLNSSEFLSIYPKYRFGKGGRDNIMMGGSKVSPGPGAYSIKGHIESSMGNGITMISRKNDLTLTSRAQTPGPGTYNPEKQQYKVPPAYRIGSASRSKFEGTEMFPGPGQYNPRNVNRPFSASYKIGSGQRSNLNGSVDTPGPGNYDTRSQLGGPKFVMAKKRENKLDYETPGPGSYDPFLDFVNIKQPSHLIGTSIRNDASRRKETPGPGQYDIRKDLGGPKYPFGSEPRSELYRGSAEPGPGSYNLPPKFADVPKYLLNNSRNEHS